jgi:AsmA protein
MRTVKPLAALAGAIILIVMAGLLAVWLLVNPNDYKDRIAAAVKGSTGRELMLKGDLKLSVFPWVALELGPASLGNPPGFGTEPFLAFDRASVRISLWRLLHKHVEIQRVEIDGLDLRLRKDERGVANWESIEQTAPPVGTAKEEAPGSVPELAGVRVTNGRVSYQGVVIQRLDFETGALAAHGVTSVRIGFDANRGVPDEGLTVSAKFTFSADAQFKLLRFEGVSLSGLLNRPGDGRPAHWEASLPTIEVNLTAQTLSVPAYDLSYSSAHVTGKLQATNFIDDLSATGSAALAPLSLREFAPRLGLLLPKTRDPRALAQLSAYSEFRYGANALTFESMQLQLDDTHLKGGAALGMQPRALRFDLTVDHIDLDRYLSVEQGSSVPLPPKPAATPAAAETSKLPDVDGTLTVGSARFSPLDFTNVRLTFASKDNVVHLFPSLAQIDGGTYSGNITLDDRGATPILSMDEHLSGVDMTRLLAATPYKGRLSGHGNLNLKATARGAALESVMQTLNGQFDANLADGALEGIDLGYQLATAQALVKHQTIPSRNGPARTKFDAFRMSAQISSGVARTTDLIIASPLLRVTGQGNANLANKAIDLQMLASLSKAPGATIADVPLKVTGTYVDPIVRPDVEALAKGELKQKMQDVLKKNGLQGLFGK